MSAITNIDLKQYLMKTRGGKEYLPVAPRLIAFWERFSGWSIETLPEVVDYNTAGETRKALGWDNGRKVERDVPTGVAIMKCVIRDENGTIRATGLKREDEAHFSDFLEKAETGAVGRALAILGIGTLYAEEIIKHDSADDPVDSPQAAPAPEPPQKKPAANKKPEGPAISKGLREGLVQNHLKLSDADQQAWAEYIDAVYKAPIDALTPDKVAELSNNVLLAVRDTVKKLPAGPCDINERYPNNRMPMDGYAPAAVQEAAEAHEEPAAPAEAPAAAVPNTPVAGTLESAEKPIPLMIREIEAHTKQFPVEQQQNWLIARNAICNTQVLSEAKDDNIKLLHRYTEEAARAMGNKMAFEPWDIIKGYPKPKVEPAEPTAPQGDAAMPEMSEDEKRVHAAARLAVELKYMADDKRELYVKHLKKEFDEDDPFKLASNQLTRVLKGIDTYRKDGKVGPFTDEMGAEMDKIIYDTLHPDQDEEDPFEP